MAIAARHRYDQIGNGFGQHVAKAVIARKDYFGCACKGRGLCSSGIATFACNQNMNIAQARYGCQGLGHLINGKLAVGDICKKKNRHQITPASSLSFEISSSTEATLMPALRVSGSVVLITVKRGVTSTP